MDAPGNVEFLVQKYMATVSLHLGNTYPHIYNLFLNTMGNFHNNHITAKQCLEKIRRLFRNFPTLIQGRKRHADRASNARRQLPLQAHGARRT